MSTAPSFAAMVSGIRGARFVVGGRQPGSLDCAGVALLVLERLGRKLPPGALPAPGEPAEEALGALARGQPGGLRGPGWEIRLLQTAAFGDRAPQLEPGDLLLSVNPDGSPHLSVVITTAPEPVVATVTRRQGGVIMPARRVRDVAAYYRVESGAPST